MITVGVLLVLAVCQPAAPELSTPGPPVVVAAEAPLFDAINRARVQHGLRPLDPDPALSEAAQENNARQAGRGMGHYHNVGTWQVVARAGSPEGAVNLWLRSPAHRRILLAPWATRMGSHWAAPYGTVNLGR